MRENGGRALKVVVRFGSALRPYAGGEARIELEVSGPVTVGTVLDAVAVAHPAVGRRVRDEAGALRRHVNIFIGADNARFLDGVATVVPEGVEVSVLPAVSGG